MSDIPMEPTPPLPETPPPVPPEMVDSQATESGLSPKLAATLACIFPLVGGIIFYLIEKKNSYVRFYALQSIYFGAGIFVFHVAVSLLVMILAAIPLLGWLAAILLWFSSVIAALCFLILYLVQIFKAFGGREWEMPLVGKYARRHLATGRFPFGESPVV